MIDDALQLGLIDYGTSVLYRAYALFGDRRLPEEYIAAGSSGEDLGLFHEATVMSNTIPPDILAQLQPFIVRPDDPISIFHDQAPAPTSVGQPQPQQPSQTKDKSAPNIDIFCDAQGWAALESAPGHFKAWARCDPSSTYADPEVTAAMRLRGRKQALLPSQCQRYQGAGGQNSSQYLLP